MSEIKEGVQLGVKPEVSVLPDQPGCASVDPATVVSFVRDRVFTCEKDTSRDNCLELHVSFVHAEILCCRGDIQEALELLITTKPSVVKSSGDIRSWFLGLVSVLIAVGAHEEVFSLMSEYTTCNPDDVGVLMFVYCRYLISKDEQRADLYYEKMVAVKPDLKARLDRHKARLLKDDCCELEGLRAKMRNFLKCALRNNDYISSDRCLEIIRREFPGDEAAVLATVKDIDSREEAYNCIRNCRKVDLEDPVKAVAYREAVAVLERIVAVSPHNYYAVMGLLQDALYRKDIRAMSKYVPRLLYYFFDDPEACLLIADAEVRFVCVSKYSKAHTRIVHLRTAGSCLRRRAMSLKGGGRKGYEFGADERALRIVKRANSYGFDLSSLGDSDPMDGIYERILRLQALKESRQWEEAKKLFISLYNDGIRTRNVCMCGFEIAMVYEEDPRSVRYILNLVKDNIPPDAVVGCMRRISVLEEKRRKPSDDSMERPFLKGNSIWDGIGARVPADKVAARVTDYSRWKPVRGTD